jgi:hypothetical protein
LPVELLLPLQEKKLAPEKSNSCLDAERGAREQGKADNVFKKCTCYFKLWSGLPAKIEKNEVNPVASTF